MPATMKRPFPISKSVKRLKIESEIFSKDINDIKLMFNDDFNEINNEKWFYFDMANREVAYPKLAVPKLPFPKLSYVYNSNHNNTISFQNTPRVTAGNTETSGSTTVSDDCFNFLHAPKERPSSVDDTDVTMPPANLKYDFINPLFLEDDSMSNYRPTPKVVLKSSVKSRIDDLTSTRHLDFAEEADDFVFCKVNLEKDLSLIDKLIANAH